MKVAKGVKIEQWIWERLERIASQKGITRNKLVETILKNYVIHFQVTQNDTKSKTSDTTDTGIKCAKVRQTAK